jgi:hypothetical protein
MARKKDTDHTDLIRLRRELVALEQRQFKLEAERKRLVASLSFMSVEESAILLAQRGYNTSPPPLRPQVSTSPTHPTYPIQAEAEAEPVDMDTAARESRPTLAAPVDVWRQWAIEFKDIPEAEADAMSKDDLKAL